MSDILALLFSGPQDRSAFTHNCDLTKIYSRSINIFFNNTYFALVIYIYIYIYCELNSVIKPFRMPSCHLFRWTHVIGMGPTSGFSCPGRRILNLFMLNKDLSPRWEDEEETRLKRKGANESTGREKALRAQRRLV
jgi:hypothetical protein